MTRAWPQCGRGRVHISDCGRGRAHLFVTRASTICARPGPKCGQGRGHILDTAGSRFWSRPGPDFGRGRVQILSRPGPDSDRGRVQILRAARSKMWPGTRPFWTRKDSLSGHARQKIWRKKVLRRTETTAHPGEKLGHELLDPDGSSPVRGREAPTIRRLMQESKVVQKRNLSASRILTRPWPHFGAGRAQKVDARVARK